ncbi:unnamed protein product [Coregonus sp. 'balchen']|nr:unnamed protein product [Coregonus sp. 'balchen']
MEALTLILFAAALVLACVRWVSGDLVSSQEESYGGAPCGAYQVANCLVMLLGVCCTYSLFNAFSVNIKQGLNWILSQLIHLHLYDAHCCPCSCQTLCHRNMDLSTTKAREMGQHGYRLPGGDVIHVGPP